MPSKKLPTKAQELLGRTDDHISIKHSERILNEDQQMELMELIARFSTCSQIQKHFVGKYQMSISPASVYQYKRTKKWIPVIKKLRERYVTEVDEVAGMHKRVRLERADDIYQKAMDSGKLHLALLANKDLREEVTDKHSVGNIVLNQFNQFNAMTDEELLAKREELMHKLKKAEITDGSQ